MSKADDTKARILEAASGEFATHGVAGARVDRISAAAGCNKNLLYVYFGNKENLFTAVLEHNLVGVYEGVALTPEDLPGFAGKVFDLAVARPDLMRLLAWSTLEASTHFPNARTAANDATLAKLADAQADHNLDPTFTPQFLFTSVMALATSWSPAFPFGSAMHPDRPANLDALRDQLVLAVRRLTSTSTAIARPGKESG